eukprot:2586007-Pyramimonas_sp.AAC.2
MQLLDLGAPAAGECFTCLVQRYSVDSPVLARVAANADGPRGSAPPPPLHVECGVRRRHYSREAHPRAQQLCKLIQERRYQNRPGRDHWPDLAVHECHSAIGGIRMRLHERLENRRPRQGPLPSRHAPLRETPAQNIAQALGYDGCETTAHNLLLHSERVRRRLPLRQFVSNAEGEGLVFPGQRLVLRPRP